MATITKGQTFGTTEQITNTKLHNLVDLATITGIVNSELASGILTSLTTVSGYIPNINLATLSSTGVSGKILYALASIVSGAGRIPCANLYAYNLLATNTSIPDLSLGQIFNIPWSTYGSIASFTNMVSGQRFTLIAGQASFPVILDAGNFLLSANYIPAKAGDNITLVWDGTNFIEVGRVSV